MIQYLLWGMSFFGLWITFIWLQYLFEFDLPVNKGIKSTKPFVSVVIPAFNEELTILKTVQSVLRSNYPVHLREVIVVDDGSTDQTKTIMLRFMKNNPLSAVRFITQKNAGKAAALNAGLAVAKGELFGCLDADTRVESTAVNEMVQYFTNLETAAVIAVVKIEHPKNVYERLQQVEYALSNLGRRVLSVLNTLFITHGALSLFHTAILRKVGGFSSESGNTEDLEVAMRLRSKGYRVQMAWRAVSFTHAPRTFMQLWRQRIRWFRGFLYNHKKFSNSFFLQGKNQLYTRFQLPMNIVGVLVLVATVVIVLYGSVHDIYLFVVRSVTIQNYFMNHVLDFPSLKEFVLQQNAQITLPLFLATVLGVYVLVIAHRQLKQQVWKNVHIIWLYFMLAPTLTTVHWMSAFVQELWGSKRRWR